jgi:uncharacterized protein YjiS (DUF1127 family)
MQDPALNRWCARIATNRDDHEGVRLMLMKPNQYDAQFRKDHAVSENDDIGLVGNIVQKIEAYFETRRERSELLSLDEHMLRDIGLNRGEAEQIASRSFEWFADNAQ